ncbi:MAG: beta-galactosidase [Oscillospiraceae bacterium]|jgi:beta-galactosidase|nr:beta-galactosidase [Oscillospiraceae bacterium]
MKPDFKGLDMLHGCDYNPEQWLDMPEILEQDIACMKKANINCVSVGIFSWACLEPEEGVYRLGWLAEIVDRLYKNGIYTILGTPSGARPVWLAKKYPEVLRVAPDMTRNLMGARHNHCFTSPVYRRKVYEVNAMLAKTLGNHPGVILWHISNEYSGACFCPLCQAEFRIWLKNKYKSLENLNKAWWTAFWSHRYTDWSQIEAPVPKGEMDVHGLTLDWNRFVTDRTVDFMKNEIAALRENGSQLPVTTNLMEFHYSLNYFKFKDIIDIVSWDSYPMWHLPAGGDAAMGARTACCHDLMRSIKKDRPFLLMESTPSMTNWFPVSKLKKPGMHMLSSMQAIAHGADSVQYFQWRKSRGGSEKFHGAVVSHDCRDDTRVFKDVAEVGERLKKLGGLCGSLPQAKAAIFFDWENRWAIQETKGPRNAGMHYEKTVIAQYRAFWEMGLPVDFVDMESDLTGYSLIAAPMLYMYRSGVEKKLRAFVENGGVLVGSFFQGLVNETDLCFLGDAPHGLTDVYGLRVEEIDALYDEESNSMNWNGKEYALSLLCERVRPSAADTLAVYSRDFYAGEAVLCANSFGKGRAYYLAAGAEQDFYSDFFRYIAESLGLEKALSAQLPQGVSASRRIADKPVAIVQNFNAETAVVQLNSEMQDYESGEIYTAAIELAPYEVKFVKEYEKN